MQYAVDYLVQILWPALIRELGFPAMTRSELDDHLRNYVESVQGSRLTVPTFFNVFASRNQARGTDMQNIPGPAPGRREIWYSPLVDLNVRTLELKYPQAICGTAFDDISFAGRVVKGGLRAQSSHFGNATLRVGGRPTDVDLTVMKLPGTYDLAGVEDSPVAYRHGRIGVPATLLLVGTGKYDMRLISSFRSEYDIVLAFDGELTQPTIPDIRARCLRASTFRIWVATAININGYCLSHIPEVWAPWIGFASMIISIVLAKPLPLASGAGRTTVLSVEEIDPWQVVGGDRSLTLDIGVMVLFVVFGIWGVNRPAPTTLLEGYRAFGHHIVLCMYYKYWWYLNVPLKKAESLLTIFSSGAVLAGTIPTLLCSPRMLENLAIGVVTVMLVSSGFVELLRKSPARTLLLGAPLFLTVPLATMFLALVYAKDNYAAMLADGKFYANSNEFSRETLVIAALLVAGVQAWHVSQEMKTVGDVLQRENGWGAFRLHPTPSRVSLGRGPVRLEMGHQEGTATVLPSEGLTRLGNGTYY